ncbi:MAG: hypothetical protein K9K81_11940 [Desulfobacteraceae bacterium]|nr:hypothetical protein [Desulfobacteraceae bacterium]
MASNIVTMPELKNRSFVFRDRDHAGAVLADDGLASGFTMFCAIDAVKNAGAENIFVAVPTAHQQAAETAGQKAARVYCPNIRNGFSFAVAEAYENWYDITEQELADMLGK